MEITFLEKTDFENTYNKLIEQALQEKRGLKREKGYEIHHIKPRALGGTNDKSNLIKLSCFEHIVAHYYIALYTSDIKMIFAFTRMTDQNSLKISEIEKLSLESLKYYAELRIEGKKSGGHTGPVSEETKKKQSLARQKFFQEHPGWVNSSSWKKGQKAWNKGLPMKEESKEKLKVARAKQDMSWRHNWHPSEEVREKLSKAHLGKKQTEETKEKRKQTNKKLARARYERYLKKKETGEFLGSWNAYQKYEKEYKESTKNV